MKKSNFPIIHIIGLPGAGKTTLAEKLRKQLNLQIYRIGTYRSRFPMTKLGEADAWLALLKHLPFTFTIYKKAIDKYIVEW